jgi:hypothetical protein
MITTTDGTQLSPCVELFIELLLAEASAVSSREVSIVRQPQDIATHFRTGLPPNMEEKKIEGGINATAARLSFGQSEIRMRGK